MITALALLLVAAMIAFIAYVRDERTAHSTWTVSSGRLGGAEFAQRFLAATCRRSDAHQIGNLKVTVQPPACQWLLTLQWQDRADGTGLAQMVVEEPPGGLKFIGDIEPGFDSLGLD